MLERRADENDSTGRHDRTAKIWRPGEATHRAQRHVPRDGARPEVHRDECAEGWRCAGEPSGTQDDAPAHEVGRAAHVGVLEVRHAACRIDGFGAVDVEAVCHEELHHRGDAIDGYNRETVPFVDSHAAPVGAANVAGL